MKKTKLNIIFTLVIAIALLLPTISINASAEKNNKTIISKNIHLTRTHLPYLKDALKYVEDKEIKILLEKIINLIVKKGEVDSRDVEILVAETGTNYGYIGPGVISGHSPDGFALILFPGLWRAFLSGIGAWQRLFGYSTIVWWECYKPGIRVNGIRADDGIGIIYLGGGDLTPTANPLNSPWMLSLWGFAVFIIAE